MPLFRLESKLVYFAHVPRCAGSSVEDYIGTRFGPLGFLDRSHLSVPDKRGWNASSPQHITVANLDRLFPRRFFDVKFTVVRHPVDRIVSVFKFQRDAERVLPPETGFLDWLMSLRDRYSEDPFYLDNHARPASDFVPPGAKVFRLEEGLDPVVDWLDGLAGNSDGPREIGLRNAYEQRLGQLGAEAGPEPVLGAEERDIIGQLYEADFRQFEYALEESAA